MRPAARTGLASCLVAVVMASGAARAGIDDARPHASAARVADVTRAIEQLERPLVSSETTPFLHFRSYWIGPKAEPHLTAISELGRSRNPDALPALIKVLKDPHFPYRFEATEALRTAPSLLSISPLIELLTEEEQGLRRMAARVLAVIAGRLAETSEDDDAAQAIRTGVDRAIGALTQMAESETGPVLRAAAISGLIEIGTDEALVRAYRLGTKDTHPMVRCQLLASTGSFVTQPKGASITPARIKALLRRSLDDTATDAPVGVLARAFYGSRYANGMATDGKQFGDCIDVNQAALEWLANLGDRAAVPGLLRAAKSSDPEMRATAASGLARFPDDRLFAQVEALLASPFFGVRIAAINGLGKSKHPNADTRLIQVLKTGSALDRRYAAQALAGSFGTSVALVEAFGDEAVEVRDAAEAAVLRSDAVVTKIEEKLAQAEQQIAELGGTEASRRRRDRLAEGLAKWRLEREEVEHALVKGLAAENPRVRSRAARVLSRYRSELSLSLLLAELDRSVSPSSEAAALALGLRGNRAAVSSLERAVRNRHEELAVSAVRALQDLEARESLPVLRSLEVSDRSARLTSALAYAIARLEALGG